MSHVAWRSQRKGQTHREVETQSHGTLEVSRAIEREKRAMADHAVTNSSSSSSSTVEGASSGSNGTFQVPPQVLARWAALASSRAYFAVLPSQSAKV